jgi:cysteinyl-tRNA synthetase
LTSSGYQCLEILEKHSAEALRLLYSQTIYSAPLNFSLDLLSNAENALKRLENSIHLVKTAQIIESQEDFNVERFYQEFEEAMDDNFNSPEAVAVIFDFVKEVNSFIAEHNALSISNKEKILSIFRDLAQDILGIVDLNKEKNLDNQMVDGLINLIIEIRTQLRAEKRFDLSDKIRDELKKLGIELEDKKGITTYKFNK